MLVTMFTFVFVGSAIDRACLFCPNLVVFPVCLDSCLACGQSDTTKCTVTERGSHSVLVTSKLVGAGRIVWVRRALVLIPDGDFCCFGDLGLPGIIISPIFQRIRNTSRVI